MAPYFWRRGQMGSDIAVGSAVVVGSSEPQATTVSRPSVSAATSKGPTRHARERLCRFHRDRCVLPSLKVSHLIPPLSCIRHRSRRVRFSYLSRSTPIDPAFNIAKGHLFVDSCGRRVRYCKSPERCTIAFTAQGMFPGQHSIRSLQLPWLITGDSTERKRGPN